LEGYAIAATKNQVFEAILIMMLRSLQAISRAFFMINLPSRVGEYAFSVEGLDRQNFGDPDYNEGETIENVSES
jgi:hypothetical protein